MKKIGAGRERESCANMSAQKPTKESTLKRRSDKSPDWNLVLEVLDAGLVAHVGFFVADQMLVIPMTYGRDGRTLFLHGSVASRLLHALERHTQVCVTVTLIDGLHLSGSAGDRAADYRCVAVFGEAKILAEGAAKSAALHLISEHLTHGRWPEARAPSVEELNANTVLKFSIDDVSAKVRRRSPQDGESDVKHPVWAGILPIGLKARPQIADDTLREGTPISDHVLQTIARRRSVDIG